MLFKRKSSEDLPPLPELSIVDEESWVSRQDKKVSGLWDGLGFAIFRRFVNACLHGYYVYTRNSGGLYVGAATFFGLLSIIPLMTGAAFLLGFFQGDALGAHERFFSELQILMPSTSQKIVSEVGALTRSQINHTPLSFLNLALFLWATKGFFSTLVSGLMKVTNSKVVGGIFMGTLRAVITIVAFCGLMMFSLELGERGLIFKWLSQSLPQGYFLADALVYLARWQILTITANILVVSMLYQWLLRTPLFACIEGAAAFVSGFLALKSFYWIYLHYYEANTTAMFGGFAPMVVGVLWGYFALTAFFMGACVAALPKQKPLLATIPKVPNSWDD
ncbi:MAG: YihY/virulence factor BrkB family protein [Bacteriovoracaceae bacterium]|nr:YihY/virulence factor BrkB family protein [Bacteriovoracaceae bacterium]